MAVTCENCAAACCLEGTEYIFDAEEVSFILEGGSLLQMIEKNERRGRLAKFRLLTNCGYLDDNNRCTVHEDPRRPKICKTFKADSDECKEIRRVRGIPLPMVGDEHEHPLTPPTTEMAIVEPL